MFSPLQLKKSLLMTLILIPFSVFAFIVCLLHVLSTVHYMALLDNLVNTNFLNVLYCFYYNAI